MNFEGSFKLAKQYGAQTEPWEMADLYDAILATPAGDVLEVGSASGGTTIVLFAAAEQVRKRVYAVDPYPVELEGVASHYLAGSMARLRESFRSNILKRFDVTHFPVTLEAAIDRIPPLSVAFIDSLHELDQCRAEFDLVYGKMVPGGMIFVHDVGWELGQLTRKKEGGLRHMSQVVADGGYKCRGIKTNRNMLCVTI
jgi:predicted O-methyltransferase YrrM